MTGTRRSLQSGANRADILRIQSWGISELGLLSALWLAYLRFTLPHQQAAWENVFCMAAVMCRETCQLQNGRC